MELDALGQLVAQPIGPVLLGRAPVVIVARGEHRLPVLADVDASLAPGQRVPGRQAADAGDNRARRDDASVRKKLAQRLEIGMRLDRARREDRLLLRPEKKAVGGNRIVQGLDAQPVAREHQPPPLRIPQRQAEHAAQMRNEIETVLLVQMHDHLDVRCRRKAVPCGDEPLAQLDMVVDLAVADDADRAVLVRDRLVAGLKVDDAQAAETEPYARRGEEALAVRAAMPQRVGHALERFRADRPLRIRPGDAANAAHDCFPRGAGVSCGRARGGTGTKHALPGAQLDAAEHAVDAKAALGVVAQR